MIEDDKKQFNKMCDMMDKQDLQKLLSSLHLILNVNSWKIQQIEERLEKYTESTLFELQSNFSAIELQTHEDIQIIKKQTEDK